METWFHFSRFLKHKQMKYIIQERFNLSQLFKMSVPPTHHSISLPTTKWEQDLFINPDLNFWTQISFCVDRFDTILWPLFCCYICWTREVYKDKTKLTRLTMNCYWLVYVNKYVQKLKKDIRDFTQKVQGKMYFSQHLWPGSTQLPQCNPRGPHLLYNNLQESTALCHENQCVIQLALSLYNVTNQRMW